MSILAYYFKATSNSIPSLSGRVIAPIVENCRLVVSFGIIAKLNFVLPEPARIKYRFVADHRGRFADRTMYRLRSASTRDWYEWRLSQDIQDRRLLPLIPACYAASSRVYGYQRVHLYLRGTSETCGRRRVDCIMKANNIKAIHGYGLPRINRGKPSIVTPNRLWGYQGFVDTRLNILSL